MNLWKRWCRWRDTDFFGESIKEREAMLKRVRPELDSIMAEARAQQEEVIAFAWKELSK